MLSAVGGFSLAATNQPVHWLQMWVQWDANYYLSILSGGYHEPEVVTGHETGQSNLNFFPLLPALTRLVQFFVAPPTIAGLLVTNAALLAASIGLHLAAARRSGVVAADWAVLSLMALPGSFILSGFMTESLFLAISIWSFEFWRMGRVGSAVAIGAWLSVTRLTGIIAPVAFALEWLLARFRGQQASYQSLLALTLMVLPLLGFFFYMAWLTGDGLAPLHSQFAFWQHKLDFPLANFTLFATSEQPRLILQSTVGLALLMVLVWSVRAFTPGELVFVSVSILSFASSSSASPSLLRYMISLYPLHFAMGRLAGRHLIGRLLLVLLALLNGALMMLWVRGGDALI